MMSDGGYRVTGAPSMPGFPSKRLPNSGKMQCWLLPGPSAIP